MAGVASTLQVIDSAKVIALSGIEVFKDGKINLADLLKLWPIVTSAWQVFKSASSVLPELQDLDSTEVNQIGIACLKAVKEIGEAIKK